MTQYSTSKDRDVKTYHPMTKVLTNSLLSF